MQLTLVDFPSTPYSEYRRVSGFLRKWVNYKAKIANCYYEGKE